MPVAMLTMRNKRTRKAACPLVTLSEELECVCLMDCVWIFRRTHCHLALCERLVTLTGARSRA